MTFSRRDSGSFSNRSSFGRRDFRDSRDSGRRELFDAVCAKCGEDCQVPFRPTTGKDVFCSNCFEKNNDAPSREFRGIGRDRNDRGDRGSFRSRPSSDSGNNSSELRAIGEKLDKIIKLLSDASPKKDIKKKAKDDSVIDNMTENILAKIEETSGKKVAKPKKAAKK
jgi:CxxC-x17-CxxC domain-containing protein